MKLAIQHTPMGDRVHIIVKCMATDWGDINEHQCQVEETACAIDLSDLDSPELGKAQYKNIYAPSLNLNDQELCPQCKNQIEKEISALRAWNERIKQ